MFFFILSSFSLLWLISFQTIVLVVVECKNLINTLKKLILVRLKRNKLFDNSWLFFKIMTQNSSSFWRSSKQLLSWLQILSPHYCTDLVLWVLFAPYDIMFIQHTENAKMPIKQIWDDTLALNRIFLSLRYKILWQRMKKIQIIL